MADPVNLWQYGFDMAVMGDQWQDNDCGEQNDWCNGADAVQSGTVDFNDL